MSLRAFQYTMGFLAAIPFVSGILGMLGVDDPLYQMIQITPEPLLDSNLRFFAGIWVAMGIAMWCILPRIQWHAPVFRLIWGSIFLGGMGRVLSMLLVGMPPLPFVLFTALEVIGAPLFIWWHKQIARKYAVSEAV